MDPMNMVMPKTPAEVFAVSTYRGYQALGGAVAITGPNSLKVKFADQSDAYVASYVLKIKPYRHLTVEVAPKVLGPAPPSAADVVAFARKYPGFESVEVAPAGGINARSKTFSDYQQAQPYFVDDIPGVGRFRMDSPPGVG
jgi:hypothetical protein